jgi:hypothetical protein
MKQCPKYNNFTTLINFLSDYKKGPCKTCNKCREKDKLQRETSRVRKSTCKNCGGDGICEHKKIRSNCKEC